jgi:HEPN domain-containing protein
MDKNLRKEKEGITTAIGLWRYGNDYYNAALTINKNHFESAFMPFYSLIGQSIELSLKAYLLANNIQLNKLRYKYGHDLIKLLLKSNENNLERFVTLSSGNTAAIDLLNIEYNSKRYHYIKTGKVMLPSTELIIDAAQKLTINLQEFCHDNSQWEFI